MTSSVLPKAGKIEGLNTRSREAGAIFVRIALMSTDNGVFSRYSIVLTKRLLSACLLRIVQTRKVSDTGFRNQARRKERIRTLHVAAQTASPHHTIISDAIANHTTSRPCLGRGTQPKLCRLINPPIPLLLPATRLAKIEFTIKQLPQRLLERNFRRALNGIFYRPTPKSTGTTGVAGREIKPCTWVLRPKTHQSLEIRHPIGFRSNISIMSTPISITKFR
jgi:hypothetical protein